MSRDGDNNSNVFVRFKQHVDANIASGINTLLGAHSAALRHATATSAATGERPLTSPSAMESQDAGRWLSTWDVLALTSSPSYSPGALRHLPRPIPNDLPPSLDSSIFTFEDAFEDLLAVSLGLPLPDITFKYVQRQRIRRLLPAFEPTWFFTARLHDQGLIEHPIHNHFTKARTPDWDCFHREIDLRAATAWRGATGDGDGNESTGDILKMIGRAFQQLKQAVDEGHAPSQASQDAHEADGLSRRRGAAGGDDGNEDFFEQTGRAFKQIQQAIDEGRAPSEASQDAFEEDDGSQRREQRHPDHFDEIFLTIPHSSAQGQNSWETLSKAIRDQVASLEKSKEATLAGNAKQVTTREAHVDRFGYTHTTVTRKTLDKDGNKIGSVSYVTREPPKRNAPEQQQLDNQPRNELDHAENATGEGGKPKSGWFWK
ncbi:hypothetical protein JDV02_002739 [Purpureocillium takamizusanense]|uniref:Uncharacterized protein n=1 Tax=Purpureocillium takamizusanense TaxID=2060973 RepID=A0A9Q8V950_9HYPO|nr:uncharacterized protein JDV02_002739 [Purpureocillium takamizusanense]UNI16296.1 hypothetical protein JDV02_002739 [Purpureocillium takamizusanense]